MPKQHASMEIVGAAAGECTKSAIVHVEREFGHLIHFRRSTNNLKHNIQQLTATKSDVQAMIDAALQNGELINARVQDWMTRADLVLVKATELSNEASVIKGWFRGWCCGRFSLGRKAEKKILVIQGICVEGIGFGDNDVSYRKPTQSLKLVGTEDFNAFASRDFTAEEIRKALLDDEANLVGVYGMPGVGKTILIKAIAKQVKEEELFQEVVVVIVSQNPSLSKLQEDIAERLDLKDLGVDLSVRADRLSERLNQDDKTTLVILDDVWEKIDLSQVGIPYKNNRKCCKVVFTTRFGDVCDKMEANTKIQVPVLSEEDSWTMFQQKSGNVADSSLARDILKECKGLPLAIVTLGLALRNRDAIVWADTLKQLRKSIFKGMSPVFSSIKLSYNYLESEPVKICFLYCCLFPEDHKIELDVLLSYVMGEKLLEDVDTYDEARGRLHSLMDILASSGLLLREGDKCVMMHDVVRDVAISIAAEEEGHIVKAGRNLREWEDMELGNCKRLSMMYNSIQDLPTFPIKATHLQALFLNNNKSLTKLPSDVFADMKSLMTLDLSLTYIETLPPSLSCLQNLRTLLLDRTRLKNMSPIAKLERLEVLIVSHVFGNYVEKFPEKLGNNLKLLDLTGTNFSKRPRPNVISNLDRLEELHLLCRFAHAGVQIDLLREVGSLSRLTSLGLRIMLDSRIEIPQSWQNLERFVICIESDDPHREIVLHVEPGFTRSLYLFDIPTKSVPCWVLWFLGRTNYLNVYHSNDLQSLTELGAANGVNNNLKSLKVESCRYMEYLVSNMGLLTSDENAFNNLVELRVVNIPAFVEICKGTPPLRFLQKLETLRFSYCWGLLIAIPRKLIQNMLNLEYLSMYKCWNLQYVLEPEEEEAYQVPDKSRISEPLLLPIFPNLKTLCITKTKIRYVFTMRVARNLMQLQHLDIVRCREMEVIFMYADGEDIKSDEDVKDSAILPRLRKLTVKEAPKLRSFTGRNLLMDLPSLLFLGVSYCGILERLPFGLTSVPNLKSLDMNQEDFDDLQWEDESVKSRLQAIL